jgi:RND family efflux transporter MFP subunit
MSDLIRALDRAARERRRHDSVDIDDLRNEAPPQGPQPPPRARRRAGLAAAALGVLALVAGAFVVGEHVVRTTPNAARTVGAPMPVAVTPVAERRVADVVGANGTVQPVELMQVTSRLAVPIERVHVDFGAMVEAGAPLAEHDETLLRSAVLAAQAEAARRAADVKRARARLARVQGLRDELQGAVARSVDSTLAPATGDRERARRRVEAIAAIQKEGLLPRAELERAQAELERATAEQRRAEEQAARVRKDLPLEIEQASAELGAAEAAHGAALDKLEQAKTNHRNSVISSSVAGIVMGRTVNPGEVPEPTKPLFTVGRIDEVLVEARVTEEQIGSVRPGDAASVTFNAFPGATRKGAVERIKPVGDQETKTFDVGVRIANPKLELKPGLTAFVRIEHARSGLMVPSPAVIRPTGAEDTAVFVVEQGVARLRRVKAAPPLDGWTEILDGLQKGEQVVTVGHVELRDGDAVRVGGEEFALGQP